VSERAGLRERKKEQTTERLQQAALQLITERGFDAVSIDDICQASDVSKTTFYRYFETKEDVLLGRAGENLEFLRAAFADCPPEESLIDAARYACGRFAEHIEAGRETKLLVSRIARTTPSLAARNLCHYQQWEDLLRSEAERRAPEGTDPMLTWVQASTVAAAVRATSEFWLEHGAERPLRELIDMALESLRADIDVPPLER
jgi:AcrR family transcriptional regulator